MKKLNTNFLRSFGLFIIILFIIYLLFHFLIQKESFQIRQNTKAGTTTCPSACSAYSSNQSKCQSCKGCKWAQQKDMYGNVINNNNGGYTCQTSSFS